ncbi:MAG: hypothetical protein WDN04_12845 [Rhodospirillales bacterium]
MLDRNEPAPAARRVPAAPRRAVVAEAPRLTLGRGIAGIDEAQNNLAAFLRTVGCDARTLFRAELVLRETLLNIRQHADLPQSPLPTSGLRPGWRTARWSSPSRMTGLRSTLGNLCPAATAIGPRTRHPGACA